MAEISGPSNNESDVKKTIDTEYIYIFAVY